MAPPVALLWLALLAPPIASAPEAPPPKDVRAVILVRTKPALARQIKQSVVLPIGEEVELVSVPTMRRAAAQARIRFAPTVAIMQRLARPLHLSHAVTVSVVNTAPQHEQRSLIEVVVVQLRGEVRVVLSQRFFLPEHHLSDNVARVIVARIKEAIYDSSPETPVKHSHPTGHGAPAATVRRGMGSPPVDEVGVVDAAEKFPTAHLQIGIVATQRNATLTSSSTPQPPCYCGKGPLDNVFPGLLVAGDVFFYPEGTSLGVRGDASISLAQTTISGPETPRGITNYAVLAHAMLTFRWETPLGLMLAPEIGFAFYHFPLSDGVFPGLAWTSPIGALRLEVPMGHVVQLWGHAGYMFLVHASDDAPRLGNGQQGWGVSAGGGLTFHLGALDLGVAVHYEQYFMSFTGQTFLYTPQRFSNVVLTDKVVQAFVTAGFGFW